MDVTDKDDQRHVFLDVIVISDDEETDYLNALNSAREDSVIIIEESDGDNSFSVSRKIEDCGPCNSNKLTDITSNVCGNKGKRKRIEQENPLGLHEKRVTCGRSTFLSQEVEGLSSQKEESRHRLLCAFPSLGKENFTSTGTPDCSFQAVIDGPSTSNGQPSVERKVLWDDTPTLITSPARSPQNEYSKKNGFTCPVCQSSFSSETCHPKNFLKHFITDHLHTVAVCSKCNVNVPTSEGSISRHYSCSRHLVICPYCKPNREFPVTQLASHCERKHTSNRILTNGRPPQSCPHPDCHRKGRKFDTIKDIIAHYVCTHEVALTLKRHFVCKECKRSPLQLQSALVHYVEDHGTSPTAVVQPWSRNGTPAVVTLSALISGKTLDARTAYLLRYGKNPISRSRTRKRAKRILNNTESPIWSETSKNDHDEHANAQSLEVDGSSLPCSRILSNSSHIIFIDLDNWGRFFDLPYSLPRDVFVWGFCGGNYASQKPGSPEFQRLVNERRFFMHPKCGKSKNAADFALCVQAARLDLQLPMHIPFTVLSGDGGFGELQNQLSSSPRQVHLVNPHKKDPELLSAILKSIVDK